MPLSAAPIARPRLQGRFRFGVQIGDGAPIGALSMQITGGASDGRHAWLMPFVDHALA